MEDFDHQRRLVQDTRSARPARPCGQGSCLDDVALQRTPAPFAAVHAARTVGAARLCQADAVRGFAPGSTVPDDRYACPRARPLALPTRDRRAASPMRSTITACAAKIIATQLANSMINRGGSSPIVRIADQTGAAPGRHRVGLRGGARRQLRHDRRSTRRSTRSTTRIPGKVRLELYAAVQDLLLDRIVLVPAQCRLVQGACRCGGEPLPRRHRSGSGFARRCAVARQPDRAARARRGKLVAAGLPDELAGRIGDLATLGRARHRPWSPIVPVSRSARLRPRILQPARFPPRSHRRLLKAASPVSDYFDRLALDRSTFHRRCGGWPPRWLATAGGRCCCG